MRRDTELKRAWKVHVKAETVGKINFMTLDAATQKPKYAARTVIVNRVLDYWIDRIEGKSEDQCRPLPTIEELRAL